MQRVTQWKKTGGSVKPTWIGLVLFGALAGGIVLTGCGGDTEETETTNTTTTKTETTEE
ncbi:MAG TPA: hypothetical protein VNA16_03945 [Abditibacteriaceae bacterium]|nr:hypothetical protein [Abditibacteriaceae bacterium]